MEDIVDDPFESPKMLVEEAIPSTHELDRACQAYLDENPMQFIDYVDAKRRLRIVGYRSSATPPKRPRVLASRIIKDLRDALDQATFQAAKALNPKAGNQTYFPFSSSPDDFDTLFHPKGGRCRDIPEPIRPFLKDLEPWPTKETHEGGNDLLRALGYVAGPNKHQITLSVSPNLGRMDVREISIGKGLFGFERNGRDLEFIRSDPFAPLRYDFGCLFFVSFKEPRQLANGPAPTVLRDLASIVERIVLGVEAETTRILRERGR